MFNDLCEYYTDRLLLLYRYKKNLLSPTDLENEIFKLDCLYKIYGWVKESDWQLYKEKVENAIGIYCTEKPNVVKPITSPEQILVIDWEYEDNLVCVIGDYFPVVDTTTTIQQTTTLQQTTITNQQTTQSTTTVQSTTTQQQTTTQSTTTSTTTIAGTTTTVNQVTVRNAFGQILFVAPETEVVDLRDAFGDIEDHQLKDII